MVVCHIECFIIISFTGNVFVFKQMFIPLFRLQKIEDAKHVHLPCNNPRQLVFYLLVFSEVNDTLVFLPSMCTELLCLDIHMYVLIAKLPGLLVSIRDDVFEDHPHFSVVSIAANNFKFGTHAEIRIDEVLQ